MNSLLPSGRGLLRMPLGLVLLSVFSLALSAKAAQPELTTPLDLRILDVNEKFDPSGASPAWVEQAPMPTARIGFGAAVVNGKIYCIGGSNVAARQCDAIPTVEAYDTGTDTWERNLAMPSMRFRAAAAALGGMIYFVGGDSTEGGVCGDVVDTVEVYDPTADSWSTVAHLNVARSQISLAVDETNNKLYAIGGSNGNNGGYFADPIVEVYDPTQDAWTRLADLTTPRALPNVGVIGSTIYALGGQDAHNVRIGSIESYNLLTGGPWVPDPSPQSMMPAPYLNPASAVIEGKIYVVGGEGSVSDNLGPQPTMQVYDPVTDSWSSNLMSDPSLPPMPGGRRLLGAAAVNDILYAIGGESPNATVNQPWAYQITATNNPQSFGVSTLPAGLSLVNSTLGIIAGIPSVNIQNFPVTISATNGDGTGVETANFYILKDPMLASDALSIAGGNCVTARTDVPFSFQVLANNATSAAVFSASGLPYTEGVGPQLTIDPATGLITGMVTSTNGNPPQSFGVTLAVSDLTGLATAQSYLQLTFVSDPTVPIINSTSQVTLPLNKSFSYTITTDPPADTFDFIDASGTLGTLGGNLPMGLGFESDTHTISGIYAGDPTAKPFWRHDSIEIIKKEPTPKIQNCGNDGTDAGTAPLVFIPSLRDYEVETLATDTGGTDYSVFTDDPLASGTGAGLLKSIQLNQYVTYTVPVPVPGTYDVRVGIKTNRGKGKFQLYIDQVAQGGVQDEYSQGMNHTLVDLGSHTFNGGDSMFQFVVVDKNPLSMGYQLVFDYIDLVPRGETEALGFTHLGRVVPVNDVNFSGGQGEMLNAKRAGQFVTYVVPVPAEGYYDVKVRTRTGTANGIFQVAVNGVNLGYTQDEYAATTTYPSVDVGTVLLNRGDALVTFTVTGRNASSTGDALVFDYIDLVFSSQLEAETLPVSASTVPTSIISDPIMSAGKGLLMKSTAMGDSISFTVHIPVGGTYDIKLGSRTGKKSGKFQLDIDGVNQGLEQDQYSAKTGYQVFDLGTMNFPGSGDSSFTFTVTSKNSSSAGYQLIFDYLELVR